jgi:hypothetical protein
MSIKEQCDHLSFTIRGALVRRPEEERSRHEKIYEDEDGNQYFLRRGILTIITSDGTVI